MYNQLGMDFVNGAIPQQQHVNPEDLFGMFGGGFPGNPFMNAQRQQQKENIVVNKEVTLEEIYNEQNVPVQFEQKQFCSPCKGEGTKNGESSKCAGCDGRGISIRIIQQGPMIQQIQTPCNTCYGSGKSKSASNLCSICNGEGYKIKEVRVNIPLKNGLTHGHQIQIPNHGHNLKEGKTDLVIVINEKTHSIFKRKGNDLFINVELKLFQALYGFDKIIDHLDKRKLHISHSGKTEYETVRKISGEGMHILNGSGGKGDLYIKFTIKLPNVNDFDTSSKLQYLLKTVDTEESTNETIIKNSKNNYVKTILLNSDLETFNREPPKEDHHHGHHQAHQAHQAHQERFQQQCTQS
jgi:DnaJ family protein A protein 2